MEKHRKLNLTISSIERVNAKHCAYTKIYEHRVDYIPQTLLRKTNSIESLNHIANNH